MRIVMSSGHGKYIRGAAGSPIPPYLDEVDEARKVVEKTASEMRKLGVEVVTFHDDKSTSQSENLDRIVDFHNSQGPHDLDVSVHFNAYQTTSKPMGCEVLYVSSAGMEIADEIVDMICTESGLINRGPKKRTDLAFLNNTDEVAVLIETAFVDSSADAEIYRENFDVICNAIAAAIAGEDADVGPEPPEPPRPPRPPRPPDERATVGRGDTGEDVEAVQAILGLPEDGDFGPTTEAGVKAYQGACGLAKDGIVGPQTWGALDELERRMRQGNPGISPALQTQIELAVQNSGIAAYSWSGHGTVTEGYYAGMAMTYALAVKRWKLDDEAAGIMAHAETGDEDNDALAWYRTEFKAEGMDNSRSGRDTLRHLFVMMIGLGVRESSGDHWCGRDMTADNVSADTCEAGAFQTSWNISSCSSTIERLFEEYWLDPSGFRDSFSRGLTPSASDLDCYGSGEGARYQWLARYSPAFHALVTGVGMRKRRQHWGPINRREVDIVPAVDELLQEVDRLVDDEPMGTAAA